MNPGNARPPRRVDVRRWQKKIVDDLTKLPREHEALEFAMAEFGADFDLAELKTALRPDAVSPSTTAFKPSNAR